MKKRIICISIFILVVIAFQCLSVNTGLDKVIIWKTIIVFVCTCISAFFLIFVNTINFRKSEIINYKRDCKGLISPILAETVIDGETEIKELIMTTIIQLHIKGNIRIINNESIELLNTENLKEYEKKIVELIFFNSSSKILKFKDINDVFKYSEEKTYEFSKLLAEIKNSILDELNSQKIISKKIGIMVKRMKLISLMFIINLPLLFYEELIISEPRFLILFFLINISIYFIGMRKIKNSTSLTQNLKEFRKIDIDSPGIIVLVIIMILLFILKVIVTVIEYPKFIISVLAFILMNVLVILTGNSFVLTSKGKKKREELLELKKYIEEYTLIKERDLNSIIIWDDYLVYATAFGIPNNIVNSIYENWYDINISLQFMEEFAKIFI